MKKTLTAKYLKTRLRYNKRTGLFFWKTHAELPPRCIHALQNNIPAGHIATNRHRYISLDGAAYLASHLAYFYVTGRWTKEIDHKDMRPENNTWKNLRVATRGQNMANIHRTAHNRSGYKGVGFSKGKWRAYITVHYRYKHLGYFDTKKAAHAAYKAAAKKTYGAFARFK